MAEKDQSPYRSKYIIINKSKLYYATMIREHLAVSCKQLQIKIIFDLCG